MKIIELKDYVECLKAVRQPYQQGYRAMYSSVLGGIVTDPALMMVPIDDHMVHRGDAVFEAFRCVEGNLYNLQAHLDRLKHSAAFLSLTAPFSDEELGRIFIATIRAGGERNNLVRLYLSRGPGGFSVNPYECPRTQLYVVVTTMNALFMARHPEGARVGTSSVPSKEPPFAGIKSTNYILNVLMKKESVDKGVDFVVGFDAAGHMTEGATENFGIVTADGRLVFPKLDRILRGTTMMRVLDLAQGLVARGELRAAQLGDISRAMLAGARELLVVGTTNDVVAVREFDGTPVGDGRPGPVYRALEGLLQADMRTNRDLLTDAFGAA